MRKSASLIISLATTAKAKLPEGRFKESLRTIFWRYSNPLYKLEKIVKNIILLNDKELFVELKDDTKFYGPRDEISSPLIKYGDSNKLDRIKNFEYFGGFLGALAEQYTKCDYERNYHYQEGAIIVDLGANIGTFTVRAAKTIGKAGRVIAIESETHNLAFLQRNIAANNLQNVVTIHKGVWSKKDRLKIRLSKSTIGEHSFYVDRFTNLQTNEFEEVGVDTLDNILNELNIKKVDFIKIDIEGAEIEAIKGMDETLANNNTIKLAGEHHIIDGKSTYKILKLQLIRKGIMVYKEGNIFYGEKHI